MAPIRPFREDDVPQVASLYERLIRSGARTPPPLLGDYFRRTFLEHPWVDPEIPSLVYEESDRVVGFLGSHARRLRFQDEPIRLACSGQLVTAPEARGSAPGAFLLRQYMDGPQALTITDGANDAMLRLWPRLGAEILHLQSIDWIRVFRPASVALEYTTRDRLGAAARAAMPFAAGVDLVARRFPRARFRPGAVTGTREELTPEKLVEHLGDVAASLALYPDYDEPFAGWLFRELAAVRSRGELFASLVRDADERVVGWYIAYARPGHVSDVVQLAASDGCESLVLEQLFDEGHSLGVSALRGRVEPRLVNALWKTSPILRQGTGALVHSRIPELVRAIRCGQALMTRLEGEWWMGHHLEPFEESDGSGSLASGRVSSSLRQAPKAPRVHLIDDLEPARERWSALAEASANLFATWEWNELWWRHFGRGRPLRIALVGDDPERPDAIVPLFVWGERPVRVLRLLGHGHGDLLGPICAAEDRERAYSALASALAAEPADLFVGDWMAGDRQWAGAFNGTIVRETGYPILRFEHSSWDDFVASRGTKQRKAIRYNPRRLAREHDVEFRKADDPDRLEQDLDETFRLHKIRFGKHSGCLFCGPSEAFQREFAAAALERGWLRLLLLYVDGAAVAAEYGFRYGDAYFSYQGGRDPAWDRHSVGFVVELETIRLAFEEGVREYRYLEGEEGYKYRFPTEDPRLETIAIPKTRRGRAVLSVLETARRVRAGKAVVAVLTNR